MSTIDPCRRSGPRVPFNGRVSVSGAGIALECHGLDLSVSGVGVELTGTSPWALGAPVEVRLSPPGRGELVLCGWLARRFEHLRHLEGCGTRGLGIAFERVSAAAREEISRYVATRLAVGEGLPIPTERPGLLGSRGPA